MSAEYPLTEALTGALFAGAALAVSDPAAAAVVAPFLGVLFGASLIDAFRTQLLRHLDAFAVPRPGQAAAPVAPPPPAVPKAPGPAAAADGACR